MFGWDVALLAPAQTIYHNFYDLVSRDVGYIVFCGNSFSHVDNKR